MFSYPKVPIILSCQKLRIVIFLPKNASFYLYKWWWQSLAAGETRRIQQKEKEREYEGKERKRKERKKRDRRKRKEDKEKEKQILVQGKIQVNKNFSTIV